MIDLRKLDFDFLESILQQLPSNIFFKDTEARYVFSTHYWSHLDRDLEDPNWTIRGKTDLEIRKDKENAKIAYEKDMEIIRTGKGVNYTIKTFKDDETQYLELIKNPVFDKNGNVIGIVGLINDITKRVEMEKELNNLAIKDSLTGVYNRTYLEQWIVEKNEENMYPLTIISGDCNGLKYINDTYGHAAGDEYIKKTAFTLKTILPSNSIVVRMGGDEFISILPNTTKNDSIEYLELLKKLSASLKIEGEKLSVAYGAVTINKKEKDFDLCLAAADSEMYKVKIESYKNEEIKRFVKRI